MALTRIPVRIVAVRPRVQTGFRSLQIVTVIDPPPARARQLTGPLPAHVPTVTGPPPVAVSPLAHGPTLTDATPTPATRTPATRTPATRTPATRARPIPIPPPPPRDAFDSVRQELRARVIFGR